MPDDQNLLNGKHIVIIEDERHVRDLEERILFMSGAETHSFYSAPLAYQFLQNPTFPVDGILTDVVIGSVNGIEYLNEMLQAKKWIPTVIASGSQASKQMLMLFEQGYAVEGNHLPLGLVLKRPSDFAANLINRLSMVINAPSFDYEKINKSLTVVRNTAQDFLSKSEKFISKLHLTIR